MALQMMCDFQLTGALCVCWGGGASNDETDSYRMSFVTLQIPWILPLANGRHTTTNTILEKKIMSSRLYGAKLFSSGAPRHNFEMNVIYTAILGSILPTLYFLNMPLIPSICHWHTSCIQHKYQKVMTMLITYETDQFYTNIELNNLQSLIQGWNDSHENFPHLL